MRSIYTVYNQIRYTTSTFILSRCIANRWGCIRKTFSPVATIFSGKNVFRVTIEKGEGRINREGSFCEVDWYTRDRYEQWSIEREGRVLWPCPRWTGWFRGRNRYFRDDDRVQRVRDDFFFFLCILLYIFWKIVV